MGRSGRRRSPALRRTGPGPARRALGGRHLPSPGGRLRDRRGHRAGGGRRRRARGVAAGPLPARRGGRGRREGGPGPARLGDLPPGGAGLRAIRARGSRGGRLRRGPCQRHAARGRAHGGAAQAHRAAGTGAPPAGTPARGISWMILLFIGDIIGRPGRELLRKGLSALVEHHHVDFVIANAENSAAGFGITKDIGDTILGYGVDVMTSGNHIWDKKEALDYIATEPRLLRPANYPAGVPGRGSYVAQTGDGRSVGVINVMGRVFMTP